MRSLRNLGSWRGVAAPEGFKPIELFRAGDLVLACPEDDPTGPIRPRLVEATFRSEARLLDLRVSGRILRTTAEHPFWVQGRGWSKALDLMAGDRLRSHNGRDGVVFEVADGGEFAAVYNLRVASDHTYFVGGHE